MNYHYNSPELSLTQRTTRIIRANDFCKCPHSRQCERTGENHSTNICANYSRQCETGFSVVSMDHSSSNSVTFFRAISKYAMVILELKTGEVLLLSEQCTVKLTAGRTKSQGGVDSIEDVITSLFLEPTTCRSPKTRIARGNN